MKSTFLDKVYEITAQIPRGNVCTYKQIAILIGSPGAARAVGNALHINPFGSDLVPCHRVVSAAGMLAENFGFGGAEQQKKLLLAEGVKVENNQVNLEKYQWRK